MVPIVNPALVIRGRIIRALGNANAFNEVGAKSLAELGLSRFHFMINVLVRRGVIMRTGDDRYYISRDYYESRMRMKKIVLPILIGVIIIGAILAVIYSR